MTVDILSLLKRLESGRLAYGIQCHSCGKFEAAGHTEDCQLVAAIVQLEAQREGIQAMAMQLADSEIRQRLEGMA